MLQTVLNAFSVQEIRKKLLFTAAILALYRLGAYIPSPGVDAQAIKDGLDNVGGNSILGFLNLISGGSLERLSLFALGIMPYITASIILQLLTVVVPSLERLQKEGEDASAHWLLVDDAMRRKGRKKKVTRVPPGQIAFDLSASGVPAEVVKADAE